MSPFGDSSDRLFSILTWDSERFGFPVARVTNGTPPNQLPAVARALREANAGLAYWFSPRPPSPEEASVLVDVGATLVDDKRTYAAPTRSSAPLSSGFEVRPYAGTDVDHQLAMLARAAGAWSRFRIDGRVDPAVFEAIYDAWIARSVRHEIADVVLTAYTDAGDLVGLATVGRNNGRADIGLVAVAETMRGKGVGRRLVTAASAWAHAQQFTDIQVVTQGANRPACALYEACGFVLEKTEYVYHLWRPFDRSALAVAG